MDVVMVTVLAIGFIFGAAGAPFWGPSAFVALAGRTHSRSPIANLVIGLLQKGAEWEVDRHEAKHRCGVKLWIANGFSFARVEIRDRDAGYWKRISLSHADRARIWLAYKRTGLRRPPANHAEGLALAKAIVAEYGEK